MLLKKLILKKTSSINSALNELNSNIKITTKFEQLLDQNLVLDIYSKTSVGYVITLKFFKTGRSVTVTTITGDTILFNIVKLNYKKNIDIEELILPLLKYCSFVKDKPVAIHLINVSFNKKTIVKKLSDYFNILVLKVFNTKPYNGCRLPRNARKKRRTKKRKGRKLIIKNSYLTRKLKKFK